MNLCEVQEDERRDREAAALRRERQSLSPRHLPCTETAIRTVGIPGPGGVVTSRRVCRFHGGEIEAALAASPSPVKPFSVPEIVRDRPVRRPSTPKTENSPMPKIPHEPRPCLFPGCSAHANRHGRWCDRDNQRRLRFQLPVDVDAAELGETWRALGRKVPASASTVLAPEPTTADQAAARNLDVALGELREVLDMDGYSPAAIVQRAAMQLRLAKAGAPSDVLREIVVRCGLPATATGEDLVKTHVALQRGLSEEVEKRRELERQLGAKESSLEEVSARLTSQRDLLEEELSYHLGLNQLTVHVWLTGGGTPRLTNLRTAAQSDANVELRAIKALLLNELAFQTERDVDDVEKWILAPSAGHLDNLRVNRLERRQAKIEEELNEALDEAGKAQAGCNSLSVRCATLESEKRILFEDLGREGARHPSSTVDITLPGGLRVLIQPVGASS